MKIKFLILLFLSVSFLVSAQTGGYRLRQIANFDKKSYFGNPQEKMSSQSWKHNALWES